MSLLQALVPAPSPRAEAVQLELAEGRPELRLRFAYCAGDARVDVEVRLASSERLPREAGYAVNGRWAERRIRSDDYAFGFADGEREVPVPDPLRALLADFVAKPSASTRGVIAERMALLEEIVDALPARGEA